MRPFGWLDKAIQSKEHFGQAKSIHSNELTKATIWGRKGQLWWPSNEWMNGIIWNLNRLNEHIDSIQAFQMAKEHIFHFVPFWHWTNWSKGWAKREAKRMGPIGPKWNVGNKHSKWEGNCRRQIEGHQSLRCTKLMLIICIYPKGIDTKLTGPFK